MSNHPGQPQPAAQRTMYSFLRASGFRAPLIILLCGVAGLPLTVVAVLWALSAMPDGDGPGVYIAFVMKAAVGVLIAIVGLAFSGALVLAGGIAMIATAKARK